jgi:hypothetical protein
MRELSASVHTSKNRPHDAAVPGRSPTAADTEDHASGPAHGCSAAASAPPELTRALIEFAGVERCHAWALLERCSTVPRRERSARSPSIRCSPAARMVAMPRKGTSAPTDADEGSLSVHASRVKRGSGFDGWTAWWLGGAWAWSGRGVWCVRAPSLISVRDLGWFRVGDMMVDGGKRVVSLEVV